MKTACCESVVFSTLIYNSYIAVGSSFIIGNDSVQFPDVERSFVSFIIKAYCKLHYLFFCTHQTQICVSRTILVETLPISMGIVKDGFGGHHSI